MASPPCGRTWTPRIAACTYRVTDRPGGGCHVAVDFHRTATSIRGRVVGVGVQLGGARRFAADLRETLARLAAADGASTPG